MLYMDAVIITVALKKKVLTTHCGWIARFLCMKEPTIIHLEGAFIFLGIISCVRCTWANFSFLDICVGARGEDAT